MGRLSGFNFEGDVAPDTSLTKEQPKDTTPATASVGERLWTGVKDIGKSIVRGTLESAARIGTAGEILLDTATGQLQKNVDRGVYDTAGMDIPHIGHIKTVYSPGLKGQGEIWSDSINAAFLLAGGETAKTLTQGIVKESLVGGAPNLLEKAVKPTAKEVAKRLGVNALLGAGLGVGEELQQETPTVAEGAKKAATYGLVTAMLPEVLGLGIKGVSAITGKASKEIATGVEQAASALEKYATPAEVKTADPLLVHYGIKSVQTPMQRVAQGTADALRKAQGLPAQFGYHVNRWNPLQKDIVDHARMNGVDIPDIESVARIGLNKGVNIARARYRNQYQPMMKEYNDVWEEAKALATARDEMNRSSLGLEVSHGADFSTLQGVIEAKKAVTSPDRWARIEKAADFFHEFNDQTLNDMVESGLISADNATKMRALYKDYIPHDIEDFFSEDGSFFPTGKTANVTQTGIKAAKGSKRALRDLDTTNLSRLVRLYTKQQRNKATRTIVDAGLSANPEGFTLLRSSETVMERRDVYDKLKPLIDQRDETISTVGKLRQELNRMGRKETKYEKELATIANEAQTLASELKSRSSINKILDKAVTRERRIYELNGKAELTIREKTELEGHLADQKEAIASLRDDLKELRDTKMKKVDLPEGTDVVSYFRDGVKEIALVPEMTAKAIKYLDSETVQVAQHWLFKLAQMPAQAIRLLATGINPAFAIFKNPARDIQVQQFTTVGNRVRVMDYAASLLTTITHKDSTIDEFAAALGDKASLTLKGEMEEAKKYGVTTLRDFAEYSSSFMGTIFEEGKNPAKQLKNLMGKNVNPLWRVVDKLNPVKAGQAMEEMSRLAAFRRGLSNGMSAEKAAIFARDATVDFEKYGPALQTLNKYIPFLNARVQGFINLGKTLKERPQDAAAALMWTAALPTAGLYAYNSQFKSYRNISDDMKRNYWIVMTGEEKGKDESGKNMTFPVFVAIPKGEAQQAVSNAVELALKFGEKNHPKMTAQYLSRFVNDITPVKDSSILPAGLQQTVELATNYSLFKDKKIEPDIIYTDAGPKKREDIKPYQRATSYTSSVAKAIGRATGWSPLKIDYLIKTGVLSDIVMMFNENKKKGSPLLQATSAPFASQLLKTSGGGVTTAAKQAAQERARTANERQIKAAEFRKRIKAAKNPEDKARLVQEYADFRKNR